MDFEAVLMQRTPNSKGRKTNRRSGAVAVEMALCTPIALTLIFGIMQVGYAFMVQHMLQDAARKACRTASFRSTSNAAVTTIANGVLTNMSLTGVTTTILVNGNANDVSTANYGDVVSVTISLPLQNILLFTVNFMNFTGIIKGSDTLRCE